MKLVYPGESYAPPLMAVVIFPLLVLRSCLSMMTLNSLPAQQRLSLCILLTTVQGVSGSDNRKREVNQYRYGLCFIQATPAFTLHFKGKAVPINAGAKMQSRSVPQSMPEV
jgi:hypothetical protein